MIHLQLLQLFRILFILVFAFFPIKIIVLIVFRVMKKLFETYVQHTEILLFLSFDELLYFYIDW